MSTPKSVYLYPTLLAALLLNSCEEYHTDNDGDRLSQPTSIYHLRRIEVTDGLKFGNTAIPAVVTSDYLSRNLPAGNMIVQDPNNTAAIVIAVDEPETFGQGDYFNINMKGATLTKENGLLVIKDLSKNAFTSPQESAYAVSRTPIDITLFGDEVPYVGPILASIQNPVLKNVDNGILSNNAYIEDEFGFTAELGIRPEAAIASKALNTTTPNTLVGLTFVENERLSIYPRNIDDFIEAPPLDTLYEGFEKNTGYLYESATFDLGAWKCTNAGGRTDAGGWILREGNYAAMLVGKYNSSTDEISERGMMEMEFGIKNVWKVEFKTALYLSRQEFWNSSKTSIKIQVSADDGATWTDLLDENGKADYDVKWNKSDNTGDRSPEATWLQTVSRELPEPTSKAVKFRLINSSDPLYFKDPNNNWAWGYYSSLPRIIVDAFKIYTNDSKVVD